MLISLLALAQAAGTTAPAVTLPPDEYEAAMMCRGATLIDAQKTESSLSLKTVVRSSFFVMIAARARPGEQSYGDRVVELGSYPYPETITTATSKSYIAVCAARFPKVAATSIALPADPLKRDLLCSSAVSLYAGIAKPLDEKNGTNDAATLEPLRSRFFARLKAANLGPSLNEKRMDALKATVDYGLVSEITRRCAALTDS